MDAGSMASARDLGVAAQLGELFVVSDGARQVLRVYAEPLRFGRVLAALVDELGEQVLEHGGEVDWRGRANSLR